MSTLVELLSGVLRFFPNTLVITLFVAGIAMGKLSWILYAAGGIVTAMTTLILQYIGTKGFMLAPLPGSAVIEACSLLPIASGNYYAVPSVWTAMSTFFVTVIFTNALNIYTTSPQKKSKEAIAVQQRKGMGLISMLAILLLFVFLMVPRYNTNCETLLGMILGAVVGIGIGVGWWKLLDACGADVYPDIHGVMLGLKPGFLREHPVACVPK